VPVPSLTEQMHLACLIINLIVPMKCLGYDFACNPHENNISVAVCDNTAAIEIIVELVRLRACR